MVIESYEQFIINAEECKKIYNGFSCTFFNQKPLIRHMREWKRMIYGIKCKKGLEYKKDIIWMYLNNELSYYEMKDILERKQ